MIVSLSLVYSTLTSDQVHGSTCDTAQFCNMKLPVGRQRPSAVTDLGKVTIHQHVQTNDTYTIYLIIRKEFNNEFS